MGRKRNCSLVVVLAVFGALAATNRVRADLTFEALGDPRDGGSWYQAFQLTATDSFENVGLMLWRLQGNDGSGFEYPAWDFTGDGASAFAPPGGNASGYAETFTRRFITTASGDSTETLAWATHFAGDAEDQNFLLSLFAFDNDWWNGSIQRAAAHWNGSEWDFCSSGGATWDEYVAAGGVAAIPGPASVLLALFGLGLVGVGVHRLRRG